MKKIKFNALFSIVLLILFVLSGCGNQTEKAEEKVEQSKTEETSEKPKLKKLARKKK